MTRRVALVAAVVATSLLGCAASESRPDVVVVVIDTLRPDYLGFYGHERETAPFLASLAARSTVLRRAYSTSSWTAPATASLFTSWYPRRHGVVEGFFAHARRVAEVEREGSSVLPLNRLPGDHRTLPEVFGDAGYRTFGLAANINIGAEIGFSRGFDRFELRHQASARELGEVLAGWLAEDDSTRPRLVYLHLNDVHGPYTRREPWYQPAADESADRIALYQGEIGYVDDALRGIFERHSWADGDAIVAVVSDHGQEFDDHGRHGHGFRLYRELVQVLALVHAPAHGVLARAVDGNVSLLDLLPTIVELAGLEPNAQWEGRSLVPLLVGDEETPPRRRLFSHRRRTTVDGSQDIWSVVVGDWHLIARGSGVELYDLAADPGELHDLASTRPEVARELLAALADFRAREPRRDGETVDVVLDAERVRQLEALGYVD